jgi:pyrrolidone-carboxylate peptidase
MTCKKRIFITGYGSFGRYDVNPSAIIARNLAQIDFPDDIEISTEVIPVAYEAADNCTDKLCSNVKPDVSSFNLTI